MKRIFYTFLMMTLMVLISFFVYLAILTIIVRHHIIDIGHIDMFLDMMMSHRAYITVGGSGVVVGYFMAQKWWQIIYIDGVYYFDKSKKRDIRRRVIKKTPKE